MHGMFVLPLLSASHPIFNNPRGKASDFFIISKKVVADKRSPDSSVKEH